MAVGKPYRPVLCAPAPAATVLETVPGGRCGADTVAAATAGDNGADLGPTLR